MNEKPPTPESFESAADRAAEIEALAYVASLYRAIRSGEKTFDAAAIELAARPGFFGGLPNARDLLHPALLPEEPSHEQV